MFMAKIIPELRDKERFVRLIGQMEMRLPRGELFKSGHFALNVISARDEVNRLVRERLC
jgi:hypothetical protein